MKRTILALGRAFALTLMLAFAWALSAIAATTTTPVSLNTSAYVSLGTGPMMLGASGGAVIYQLADSQPTAGTPGLVEQPGAAAAFLSTTSQVWAMAGQAATVNAVVAAGSGLSASGAPTISVGSGSFATVQAAPGATATLIVAARTGASGTGRIAVTILNSGSVEYWIGVSGVTTSTGVPLQPGASQTLNTTAAVYGITAGGVGAASALETF